LVIIDNNIKRKGCDIINNEQFVQEYQKYISSNVLKFEHLIKSIFNNSSDLAIRTISNNKNNYFVVYIDGLVNKDLLDRDVIRVLNYIDKKDNVEDVIQVAQINTINISIDFINDVLDGNIAILNSKEDNIIICDLKGWNQRAIETPDSEVVVRGPKEAFTETLRVNTSLIRRKIKNPNLVFENLTLGKQTNTQMAICYIEGIVNKEVLEELKLRLSTINVDSILETGYIEQYIEENTFLPMPTVGATQKPDVVAAKILEGRIAIICDGTPHVATVPHLFIENMQTSEDYYHRPYLATFFRLLRFFALLIISILLARLLCSNVTTYHQEMIPSVLLRTIAACYCLLFHFLKESEALIMLIYI
jgi:spore germination protein KA